MSARATNVGPAEYLAQCYGCNWGSEARNAMGNAAQHHDATGHAVRVETTRVVTYGDPAAPAPGQTALELEQAPA
jgi:hypothetical protein